MNVQQSNIKLQGMMKLFLINTILQQNHFCYELLFLFSTTQRCKIKVGNEKNKFDTKWMEYQNLLAKYGKSSLTKSLQ